ncbi:MAG: ornithine cyclodeaminase [Pseudonocardiales bacterium]|nr:ornithine cyclodeaminase [Pseudonocardiales bacterium]MBV9029401.1 ornithine cyclodeaminase [Pseudonocardiales bacterium]MBW0011047.1 ornithine cyclodeaminase [Pseudonocardiales bacterium]
MTESVLFLNRSAVETCVAALDLPAVLAEILRDHTAQRAVIPKEGYLAWTNSSGAYCRSITMLGGLQRSAGAVYGLKVINAAVSNPQYGLERAGGFTFLFDAETARPKVIAEAGYLSAVRTAGYSVLSIEQLGPASWDSVSILGCGTQAGAHVDLLVRHFPGFRALHVFDLDRGRAEQFTEKITEKYPALRVRATGSARAAVHAASLVITVTTSSAAYIPAAWIEPGSFVAHVSLDDLMADVFQSAQALYVDDVDLVRDNPRRILGQLLQEGTVSWPAGDASPGAGSSKAATITGTLGMVLEGRCPAVRPSTGYVVSNPFGMSILDVGLIAAVHRQTRLLGLGQVLELH